MSCNEIVIVIARAMMRVLRCITVVFVNECILARVLRGLYGEYRMRNVPVIMGKKRDSRYGVHVCVIVDLPCTS